MNATAGVDGRSDRPFYEVASSVYNEGLFAF